MNTHHFYLIVHLLAATIWVGGHLILAIGFLPKALKHKEFNFIKRFEKVYEPIGMPSLLLLIITGVAMSYDFQIELTDWFSFENPLETTISLKILGVLLIIVFAISAQTRVLPSLEKGNVKKLCEMAIHIVCVTLISILLLILGSYARYGGVQF